MKGPVFFGVFFVYSLGNTFTKSLIVHILYHNSITHGIEYKGVNLSLGTGDGKLTLCGNRLNLTQKWDRTEIRSKHH